MPFDPPAESAQQSAPLVPCCDTEELAAVMHDAFYAASFHRTKEMTMFALKRQNPDCLDECNAWREAASAASRRIFSRR